MIEDLEYSTDPERIDLDFLSKELSRTYWGKNRTKEKLRRIVSKCFVIGLYRNSEQIGFGRVVTDFETHAYIMDVIVKETERGKGLGRKLMKEIIDHSAFSNLEAFSLKTKDAGGFYEALGFKNSQTNQFVLMKKDWDNQSPQTTSASVRV